MSNDLLSPLVRPILRLLWIKFTMLSNVDLRIPRSPHNTTMLRCFSCTGTMMISTLTNWKPISLKSCKKIYNFSVEQYLIRHNPSPNTTVATTVNKQITAFIDRYGRSKSLLSYVYSGHAHAGIWHLVRSYGSQHKPRDHRLPFLTEGRP